MLTISTEWEQAYPQACLGLLVMNDVENPTSHAELDQLKQELELELRTRYSATDRRALRRLPTLAAYDAYYRQFSQTYHVQLQLESIVFKKKSIPSVAALVEAMFMAELKNWLLTAGHDLAHVDTPVQLGVAAGSESYLRLNGSEQQLKAGDMMIRDQIGVISCILYGPDRRTSIQPDTSQILFTTYAPAGISPEQVQLHLEDIRDYVLLVAPEASVERLAVLGGN